MTDIRVIIRELSRGTSLREMERKLQLSRTSLRNYRDRINVQEILQRGQPSQLYQNHLPKRVSRYGYSYHQEL